VNKGINELGLKIENLEIRVDLPLKDSRDSLQKHIEVGNLVSLDPKFHTVNGFVKSRHLDNKASAAILLHVAELLEKESRKLSRNIYLFFNTTEETGQGISGFPQMDDFIAVDMGVVGDGLQGDEFHVSICAKDSIGPYNYELTQSLIHIAKQERIAYKSGVFPFYASDGSGALRSGADMRVALIGPGVSASHGYERTHIDALLNTAKLIVSFIEETALE
jgi:putative aminopeptidase FrvX